MAHELRHALGRLGRSPGFTAAAALSLALAIGANVTIFTVVDRVVLNPLPYPDSVRLVNLTFAMPSRNISAFDSITARQYDHFTKHARTLSALSAYRTEDRTITGRGGPERVRITRTTPSLASVLRVNPAVGRWFSDAEGVPGSSAAVAVLSNGLWTRRYGAQLDVVGQPITIDGTPSTIIGVMPASFAFPDRDVDIWLPEPWSATDPDSYSYAGVARLADGVTIEGARAELTTLSAALEATAPTNGYRALVSASKTLHEATIGQISTALWVLLASAGIVLLVACANIANLFLVRSEGRQREIGVRRALGARTGNVAAYFLAESAILSAAGGALGLAAAWGGVRLLVAYGPTTLPRLQEIRVTPGSAAFTLALCALSAVAFGAVPLLRLRSSSASLQQSERGATAGRHSDWTRRLLMAGQVALALVLLIGAGLLLRSFQRLSAMDHGFDPASALTFQVGLPPSDYPERQTVVATHQTALEAIARLPGVTSASMTNCVPLSGRGFCGGAPLFVEGDPDSPPGSRPIVAIRPVAGSFFETMRIPIRRGRGITPRDVENNELVAVVNEAFVRAGLANRDPIGMRVRLGPHALPAVDAWFTIVGVVPTTPTVALGESTSAPKLYIPMIAARNVWPAVNVMTYVVRTTTPPTDLTQPIRAAIGGIDRNLAMSQVRTLQSFVDAAGSQRAFTLVLLLVASGTALLLGLVGIYSVTSYLVSQRTAEIGVRLALGAEPGRVMRMVVRQGATVAAGGIATGLLAAFATSPAISPLLYGVNPRDPGVFATVALTLMTVALVACWLPARRAASVDPLVALRSD